jgi:hypothetical protein
MSPRLDLTVTFSWLFIMGLVAAIVSAMLGWL